MERQARILAAAAVGWCSARRRPRHGLINVRAIHTTSPMVSASVGYRSGATAGLSVAGFHPRPRLAARLGMRPPFVRTTSIPHARRAGRLVPRGMAPVACRKTAAGLTPVPARRVIACSARSLA